MGMPMYLRVFVVVQSSPAQMFIVDRKTQWFNQMQAAAGVGGKSNHVACVGGYFGLDQDNVEHAPIVAPASISDSITGCWANTRATVCAAPGVRERSRCGVERCAGGHYIVHQHHLLAAQPVEPVGMHREGVRHIGMALPAWQAALRRRVPDAHQEITADFAGHAGLQGVCQHRALVKAAFLQPLLGQRHGHNPISGFQRGINPGCAAHHPRKTSGPRNIGVKFEAAHHPRPRDIRSPPPPTPRPRAVAGACRHCTA
jgi:hypothetical protein